MRAFTQRKAGAVVTRAVPSMRLAVGGSMTVIGAVLLAAGCAGDRAVHRVPATATAKGAPAVEEQPARLAETWLRLNDAGQYAESWAMGSPRLHGFAHDPASLEKVMRESRPKGDVRARTLISSRHMIDPAGKPPGEYIRVSFETIFSEDGTAVETVGLTRASDGGWQVAGARIAPAAVEDNTAATIGLARASTPAVTSRPIATAQVENLVAFTNLLGDLRYFHPSDEGASADWEALAVHAVPFVLNAKDPDALAATLARIFQAVAPTVRIYATGHPLPPPPELAPPAAVAPSFVGWVHHGVALDVPQPLYSSTRVPNGASAHVAPGDLAIMLPFHAVRGKRIRLRASARAELANSRSSAVLHIFTISNAGYRIVASAPVASAAWADLELLGDLSNVERGGVFVGLRLLGDGKAWLDDVNVSVLDEARPPAAVSVENWGFEASKSGEMPAGWDEDGVQAGYRVTTSSLRPRHGTRCGQLEAISQPVESLPVPAHTLHMDLGAGVSADLPLTLYVDEQGRTIPAASAHTEAPAPMRARQFLYSGNDPSVRIADVALTWSVLAAFFPYFDVVAVDWPAQLRWALARAARDPSAHAFHGTLRRLVASLKDGHGWVSRVVPGPNGREAWLGTSSLPIAWRLVEGQLVVTDVGPAAGDVRPGDVVVAIDRAPATQALAAAAEEISAGTQESMADRAPRDLLTGPSGDDVEITFRRGNGAPFSATLRYENDLLGTGRTKPEPVAEVAPGILYADLTRIDDHDFQAALPRLVSARGVVFDVRGYPGRVSLAPLRHLTDLTLQSAHELVPKATRPGRSEVVFEETNRSALSPLLPRIGGRVAFLVYGRAVSYAESYLGLVEAYTLGALVGERTAGTNGNINAFRLPGGYRVTFTGLKELKHDGSRHHGVGIAPTVPCAPTVAGIAAGRDEVLECGIAALSAR